MWNVQLHRKTCRMFSIGTIGWLQPSCCHILVLLVFFSPFRNQEVFWFCLVSCVLAFISAGSGVSWATEELRRPAAEALMGTSLKLELGGLLSVVHDSMDYLCFANLGKTQLRRDRFAELAHWCLHFRNFRMMTMQLAVAGTRLLLGWIAR